MALNLAPVLDYILVKKTEEKLEGGLYLAAPADPTAPRYAEVIATGPGRPSEYSGAMIYYGKVANIKRNAEGEWETIGPPVSCRSPVEVGQTILMHGGAGTKIVRDRVEYWAILPRDIIAVVSA